MHATHALICTKYQRDTNSSMHQLSSFFKLSVLKLAKALE